MPTVLVVHHTVSPALDELVAAVVAGIEHPELEGSVRAALSPALSTTAADVLAADAYALITPVNIGYMSGALKHVFDTIYYPCLSATIRRPYALVAHGGSDLAGGIRSVETIASALQWTRIYPPLEVVGAPGRDDLTRAEELGSTLAAAVMDR